MGESTHRSLTVRLFAATVGAVDSERTLTPSAFPDDDGQASAGIRAALAEASTSRTPASYLRAVTALCLDRVLVPVVATATRMGATTSGPGLQSRVSDKEAEMSVVLLQTGDGRRAMLAFTGLDALQSWSAEARPVPVTLDLAAQSAVADQATALLVDFAGPHPLVIEGEVLAELALGHRLVELDDGGFGWAVAADPFPPLGSKPAVGLE
jgi:hypothetical protein